MSSLAEIEAAVETLPREEQESLLGFLVQRLRPGPGAPLPAEAAVGHSVLDIPPAHVGRVLRPLGPGDDLLGEMLEDRV